MSSSQVDLRVDWCSYAAAKYAVMHWHYSKVMPAGKNVYVGVWESDKFIGSIIFGTGVAPYSGMAYELNQLEITELVRVALNNHKHEVTTMISASIRLLKKQSSGLRMIVSYADPEQGHNGGIYQAGNWIYSGIIKAEWFVDIRTGERINTKTLKTGRRGYATKLKAEGKIRSIYLFKHKYLYPLDKAMRRQIAPLAKPYPRRSDEEPE